MNTIQNTIQGQNKKIGSQVSIKRVGQIGENIATRLIKEQGYTILDRNYRKKIGEIDIIAEKNGTILFFEVKTAYLREGEPKSFQWVFLEEKITPRKQGKIRKVAMLYLNEKHVDASKISMSVGTICIAIRRDFEVFSFKILKDVVV